MNQPHRSHAVNRLDPNCLERVYQVLFRAFYKYPLVTYVFPEEKCRDRSLAWYMGYSIRFCMQHGENWVTQGIEGIASWVIPGAEVFDMKNHFRNGWLTGLYHLGIRSSSRSQIYESFSAPIHKREMPGEHAYLWVLAVDPDYQGVGTGSALLDPMLKRMDEAGLPCYLETHVERNLPFYSRHGFNVVFSDSMPGTGLAMWAMARQPGWVDR